MIPPGGEELKGDEVDRIVNFKSSIGIDDPDAATVHIEVIFVLVVHILVRLRVLILRICKQFCLTGLVLVDPVPDW